MIKRTLFFGNPAYLNTKNEQLVITYPDKDQETKTVAIEDIGIIVLENQQITITNGLLEKLIHNKVAIINCDKQHLPIGLLMPELPCVFSPIGIFLAIITTAITHETGIDFSQYKEVYSNFGYSAVFYPKLSMRHLYIILILVVITAFVSALFPAKKALKINIAESLKK